MGKIPNIKYKLDENTIDPDFAEGYFGKKKEKKLIVFRNLSEEINKKGNKEEIINNLAKKLHKEFKIKNSENNLEEQVNKMKNDKRI